MNAATVQRRSRYVLSWIYGLKHCIILFPKFNTTLCSTRSTEKSVKKGNAKTYRTYTRQYFWRILRIFSSKCCNSDWTNQSKNCWMKNISRKLRIANINNLINFTYASWQQSCQQYPVEKYEIYKLFELLFSNFWWTLNEKSVVFICENLKKLSWLNQKILSIKLTIIMLDYSFSEIIS